MDLSTISVEDKKSEKVCTVLQYYARKSWLYLFLELHADDIVNFCHLYPVLHPHSHCPLGLNYFYIDSVFLYFVNYSLTDATKSQACASSSTSSIGAASSLTPSSMWLFKRVTRMPSNMSLDCRKKDLGGIQFEGQSIINQPQQKRTMKCW